MGVYGPIARSVADLRLCVSLIEGPDGRQASVLPAPPTPVPEQALREYRIAWTDDFGGVPVTTVCADFPPLRPPDETPRWDYQERLSQRGQRPARDRRSARSPLVDGVAPGAPQ
jgi:hypothetical protein